MPLPALTAGRRRAALLFVALFALYAATLGVPAFNAADYGGDEPHYLLAAESLVTDGDVDVRDEHRQRAWSDWYPYPLEVHGRPTDGRLHEPHGIGFPLLIAPAYAVAGPLAVELLMAALAALAFVLAAVAAGHLVPEPWATRGVALVAASPPALAYGTAVYPELAAGAALVGASLLAVRARERPSPAVVLGGAALLAALPWLGTKYALPAAPVLALLLAWTARRRRDLALLAGALAAWSALAYVEVSRALYGGPTPYSADVPGQTATDAAFPAGYLERLPRLAALWVDRDYGLVRWAPVLALAAVGAGVLWRSRVLRLARVVPARAAAEALATLLLAVVLAQVVVAAFGAPTMFGFWFPGRHGLAALPALAAFVAWGLPRAARVGAALGALTLLGSAWLYVEERTGAVPGWVAPDSSAPWGPLEAAFPLYGTGSAWADVVSGVLALLLAAAAAREWRHWRHTAGATRRAYSP